MSSSPLSMNDYLERLPDELVYQIAGYVDYSDTDSIDSMELDAPMDPSIPPADGSSPLLRLPVELRRAIFSFVLPPVNKLIEPLQNSTEPQAATNATPAAPVAPAAPAAPVVPAAPLRIGRAARKTLKAPEKESTLAVGDALVLCKLIAAEILVKLYEERTFALNVYEGIRDGGIEFLNSGRQRLQYREHFTFVRFKRFEGPDNPFAFSRIKQLLIRVYPATEAASEHKSSRHDSMHTHFMIRALVQLLRHENGFSLNRLQIRFVEPHNTSWRPHPWQNTSSFSVRSSSIHGISSVEVVLRGLLELRQVHTAVCELPPGLYRDTALAAFVDRLQGVITGKLHPSTMDDEITMKIEGARDMLDNWIHFTMFGTAASKAMNAYLGDSDFIDEQDANPFDYYPDQDGFFEPPVSNETTGDSAVVNSSPALRDVYEERITTIEDEEDQDTKPLTSKPRTSAANNTRPARTASSRRSARISPTSSRHGSSGGASLLGIISIEDDDLTADFDPLNDDNGTSAGRRRTRILAECKKRLEDLERNGLRRSARLRFRNITDSAYSASL
jgi:hypothetical protein